MDLTLNTNYDFLLLDYSKERDSINRIQDALNGIQDEDGWCNYQIYFRRKNETM